MPIKNRVDKYKNCRPCFVNARLILLRGEFFKPHYNHNEKGCKINIELIKICFHIAAVKVS
jgi:hypothetical protein